MKQRGFVLLPILIIVIIMGIGGYLIYQNRSLNNSIREIQKDIDTKDMVINDTTSINQAKNLVSPSPASNKPAPTLTKKSFEEEERLMRKTLSGFEMYIGTSNTAGALSFFTPPKTDSAKEKYEEIRTKNLPYSLRSWSFVEDENNVLVPEEIKGGYRVRTNECRTNTSSCSILFFELVRDEGSENGFSIDRYYTTAYMYQNNLGEEIKYQGFGL